jgi:hypothetical protein
MSDQPVPATTTNPKANPGLSVKGAALLLLAIVVIIGGVIYGVASWQYRSLVELKDAVAKQQTTIQKFDASVAKLREDNNATLAKLREENSASLDKLRAESNTTLAGLRAENSAALDKLRAENAELRAQLTAAESRAKTTEAAFAKSQQRDPDAIYQSGVEVGRVSGANEDRASSTVTFEAIEGGNFDRGKEFDYRDLTLMVKSHQGAMTSITGRGIQTQLTGVSATIVKTRTTP